MHETPADRVAELEAALAAEREALAAARAENRQLREAYQQARLELELMRRRLFVAKAERIDTTQLELELGHKLAELDRLTARTPTTSAMRAIPPAPAAEAARADGRPAAATCARRTCRSSASS